MSYTLGSTMGAAGDKVITFDDFFDKIWSWTIGRVRDIPVVGSFFGFLSNTAKNFVKDKLREKISEEMNITGNIDSSKKDKIKLNTESICAYIVNDLIVGDLIYGNATGENLIQDIAGDNEDVDTILDSFVSALADELIPVLNNAIVGVLDDYFKVTTLPGGDVPGMDDDEIDTSGFHWHRPGSFAPQAVTRDESLYAVTAAPASGSSNMMLIFGGVGAFLALKYLKVF
jgi:hypothetical protein